MKRSVDSRKVQAAGNKAVAPGTPIHALQKRLKGVNRQHAGGIVVQSKIKISPVLLKRNKKESNNTNACTNQFKTVKASTNMRKNSDATGYSILEGLLLRVGEATQLAQFGSCKAASMLLENMLNDKESTVVASKALYWVARSRIAEVMI